MPVDAVQRFIADPASGDFDVLAARAVEAARAGPSRHLRRAAADAALAASGVAGSEKRPILALAAEGESRLVDGVLATRSDDAGARPIRPRGVDRAATRSWLAARQRDRRRALLVGAETGFDGLLTPIERRGLKFRLPAGSSALVVRRSAETPDDGLRTRLIETLGLAVERLCLGWEVDGVATPFLAPWRRDVRYAVPHWVRVEVDADGRLVVTDLANLGGEVRVVTEVRATIEKDGFVLL